MRYVEILQKFQSTFVDFDTLDLTSVEGEFGSMNNVSLREIRNSEHGNSLLNEVPGSRDSDSETDQDDLESLEAELEAALMESPTLQRVDEDDVALDMDGWDLDGLSSEDELSDEGESEEEEGDDFPWEEDGFWLDVTQVLTSEALAHGPVNNDQVEKSKFLGKNLYNSFYLESKNNQFLYTQFEDFFFEKEKKFD